MAGYSGRRLRTRGIESNGATIEFRFEGETIEARTGESLAAALTAAGQMGLRQAGTGDRRGLFCGMGACQECLVEIDGRSSQRACMTKVAAGMDVRRQDSAHAHLAPLGIRPEHDPLVERCDVAIVGAGPAGLAAARLLGQHGVKAVLIDEREAPGGQYFKPLAPSSRFAAGGEDDQFAAGRRLIAEATALGAEIRSGQSVWHASNEPDGRIALAINAPGGATVLEPKAVLIATGAYEQPYAVPGWTLPGVMTTGAAQTLARSYRVTPGERVLIAGNGPLNWQVALEIARGGGIVVGVIESGRPSAIGRATSLFGMLRSNSKLALAGARMRLDLARRSIPLHEGMRVVRVEGAGKVERVIAGPVSGGAKETVFTANAICLGYGFVPSTEIFRMLGGAVMVDVRTGYPVPSVGPTGGVPGKPIWIAGDAGGIGGSEVAQVQGAMAAVDILDLLNRGAGVPAAARLQQRQALDRARSFQACLWSLFEAPHVDTQPSAETILCRCENVTAGAVVAMRAAGVQDLASLKRQTRLGMGRCQGRYCAGAALKILRSGDLASAKAADLFAPQAPAKPVPAIVLAAEKPEWGGHREVETIAPRNNFAGDPVPGRCDLLIIGAGITGAATAMYAARAGMDTVVIDRSPPNSQASGGNAGSLHVQLLSWDFGKKAMAGGNPALQTLPLQRDSVALWKSLEVELGADFEIVTTGGLMVAENADQTAFLRDKAEAEQRAGINVEVIGRSDLAALAPAVSERMVVAAYCAAEGKINPLKATPAIVAEAERHGARFAAGHEVTAIAADGNGYVVTTNAATIRARRVVIAAGGWSRQIGRMVGAELPISGAPLQMLVTEPTRPILKQLIAHADRHLTMKQATNGNLIIGGAWTADTNASTGYARVLRASIEGNLWVAERTVPQLSGLHLLRSWAAMNINIDGAPLLGEIPGAPGVFIAATANGYTLGPIMGQITAELAAGRSLRQDLKIFTLDRFN